MDPFSMGFIACPRAVETTIPNDSAVFHEPNLSAASEGLHRYQSAEPDRVTAGPNRHAVGTGIGGHALNHGQNIGNEHQYQSTFVLGAQTAWMANVSDPKKQARRDSDRKYRENKKRKVDNLERELDNRKRELDNSKRELVDLTEKYKASEDENASLRKNLWQLKDNLVGQTTTTTEMCRKVIARNEDHNQGTGKKQKMVSIADWRTDASEERWATKMEVTSYTIKDVMADIQALPGIKDNPKPSESWLRASFRLKDPKEREIYMSIEDPEDKLEWLKIASE